MTQTANAATTAWTTVADLCVCLGDVPPQRIRLRPPPGTATEQDVLRIHASEKRLCELVDGVLVEKAVGTIESYIAGRLFRFLDRFVEASDLGIMLPPDGMMRFAPGLIRIPDLSFISWDRVPREGLAAKPVAEMVPDLAVEILSRDNTKAEMDRKLQEYFEVGVRLVWYVEPRAKQVQVFRSTSELETLSEADNLDGGAVLPGFTVAVAELFIPPTKRSSGQNAQG